MKIIKYYFFLLFLFCSSFSFSQNSQNTQVGLTLIPPSPMTNKVDVDIRAGIINHTEDFKKNEVSIYLIRDNESSLIHYSKVNMKPKERYKVQLNLNTSDKVGMNKIRLKVENGDDVYIEEKELEIIDSDIRSTRQIDGAWMGIYHWSEVEGKNWNKDIKKLTDNQWREIVSSMNSLDMNIIVIQEVFRNEEYVGKHSLNVANYNGKAFYPSNLYSGRMPIVAKDPIEAILDEADKNNMSVLVGVGMFAWFDFSSESLEWHKAVAKELWEKYGHHKSFYGFYVSEESGGSLDNWETTLEHQLMRKKEIVDFFREFRVFCNNLAPDKPIMLATNSMGVPYGADTYPALLENLDILCPFGFARMPEDDISGSDAAQILQEFCDDAGAHLWFDLETFLFNPDQSLYPRPMEEIVRDLTLFDNFEKILCYQYPGVFSDPESSIRVGEKRTFKLFNDYKSYLKSIKKTP